MPERPFSRLKATEKFAAKWQSHGLPGTDITTEFRFHDVRKWRFDYAFPSQKLAVEIDGYGYGHQSPKGMEEDCFKRNAAVEEGWRVLIFVTTCLSSHAKAEAAVEQVCRVLTRAVE